MLLRRLWAEARHIPVVRFLVPILYGLLATLPLTVSAAILEQRGETTVAAIAGCAGLAMGLAVWHVIWSAH